MIMNIIQMITCWLNHYVIQNACFSLKYFKFFFDEIIDFELESNESISLKRKQNPVLI